MVYHVVLLKVKRIIAEVIIYGIVTYLDKWVLYNSTEIYSAVIA